MIDLEGHAVLDQEIRYLGDLQRLEVRPNDMFVLMVPGRLSADQRDFLRQQFQKKVGKDRRVLVLTDGVRLGVVEAPA